MGMIKQMSEENCERAKRVVRKGATNPSLLFLHTAHFSTSTIKRHVNNQSSRSSSCYFFAFVLMTARTAIQCCAFCSINLTLPYLVSNKIWCQLNLSKLSHSVPVIVAENYILFPCCTLQPIQLAVPYFITIKRSAYLRFLAIFPQQKMRNSTKSTALVLEKAWIKQVIENLFFHDCLFK